MRKSFTLLELIIVVGIIAILAVIAFPVGNKIVQQSRDVVRKNDLKEIKGALEAYYTEEKKLPNHDDCLTVDKFPNLKQYLKNGEFPSDPLTSNEIEIGLGGGECSGKNWYYYIPLEKDGEPANSYVLVADTERDGINKDGYISSKEGHALATMKTFEASRTYENILLAINNMTTDTGKNNVFVMAR